VRRILLVEDHAWFRQTLASLLATEHQGLLVEQAGSFFEGRRLIRIKGRYDVMVVDLGLPDGDVVQIVRELREAVPSGAIVILTISVDPRKIDEAFEAGADEVLSKVTPLREIVATVERFVAP
jgi:two-component system, NarL family, response regulator DevR